MLCLILCLKHHCVKSVQIRCFFWSVFFRILTENGDLFGPNTGKYGLEKTPYLDNFQFSFSSIISSTRVPHTLLSKINKIIIKIWLETNWYCIKNKNIDKNDSFKYALHFQFLENSLFRNFIVNLKMDSTFLETQTWHPIAGRCRTLV